MCKLLIRITYVELANPNIEQELLVLNESLASTVAQNKPDYANECICRNYCDTSNAIAVVIATDEVTDNLG